MLPKCAIKWGVVWRKIPLKYRDFHRACGARTHSYGIQTPTFVTYEPRLLRHMNRFYWGWGWSSKNWIFDRMPHQITVSTGRITVSTGRITVSTGRITSIVIFGPKSVKNYLNNSQNHFRSIWGEEPMWEEYPRTSDWETAKEEDPKNLCFRKTARAEDPRTSDGETKGCGFFAYSWKLPAYSGAFLLTVDNFSFFTYNWSFFCLQF